MTPLFPPSLPSASLAAFGAATGAPSGAAGGSASATGLSGLARSGGGEGALLRAEVEPEARGLGVLAHAERVLAALDAAGR